MILKGIQLTPDVIEAARRKTTACSCSSAGLQCSHFCGCQDHGCQNKLQWRWRRLEMSFFWISYTEYSSPSYFWYKLFSIAFVFRRFFRIISQNLGMIRVSFYDAGSISKWKCLSFVNFWFDPLSPMSLTKNSDGEHYIVATWLATLEHQIGNS